MHDKTRQVVATFYLGMLCACSGPDEQTNTEQIQEKPENQILNEQLKAMEKAKQVEQMIKQADQERRQQLEEMSR